LCSAANALINNFDKIRIARADHPLRIYKAVNVNRDPAAIHEHEVLIERMALPADARFDVREIKASEDKFAFIYRARYKA
jgi:hypothetical protein